MPKFMIHFRGAAYSNELYDERGREVFELEAAKDAAAALYPDAEYELYNGEEGYRNYD